MKALIFLFIMMSFNLQAQTVEQKELNFKVDAETLLKGQLHYSFQVLSPEGILKLLPQMRDFDTLGLLKDKSASLMVNKIAMVVNKPVGFFDQRTLEDQNYLAHLLAPGKLKKITANEFQVNVPVPTPYNYKLKVFFDSDDISTVANSKAVKAVTAAKQIDVLAQSASSIFYYEMYAFSLIGKGALRVEAYVPLKEERTLLISFQLFSLLDYKANTSALKGNTVKEFENFRKLVNSYKPE